MTHTNQPAIVGKEALLNLVNWVERYHNGSVTIESWRVGQCADGSSISPDQADRRDGNATKESSEAGEGI